MTEIELKSNNSSGSENGPLNDKLENSTLLLNNKVMPMNEEKVESGGDYHI